MKRIKLLLLIITLMLITPNVCALELKTGTYKIYNANDHSKMLVEKDGNIELGDANSTGITTWNIYSNGDYFFIRSSSNNSMSLGATAGAKNGTNLKAITTANNNYQKWKLIQADTNYHYFIRSALGNYNVDVSASATAVGTNIQLWQSNNTNAQKWVLERIDEKQPVLDDGTYIVRASNNSNNVVDLSAASTKNSSNIQMFYNNYTWAQFWNIKYVDGYYRISTYLDNNKVFDIRTAAFKNCSNIQLFQSNNTNAQKWLIEKNSDGTFSLSTYDGIWKMDISAGSTKSGANLQIYQTNGTAAQKFVFEKSSMELPANGYYTIDSLLGTNMVVGINSFNAVDGKNILLTKNTNARYTKWYFKKVRQNIYTIANAANKKKVLDVLWAQTKDCSNVQLFQNNGTAAQQWIVHKNVDGTYRLVGVGSSKSLDISAASSKEGTNIQIYTSNNTNAQKFKITPIIDKEYEIPDEGNYVIKSNLYQDKVVDVSAAAKDNNTNVQLWAANNTNAQVWKLDNIGEGKYVIKSLLNPNTVLSASASNVVLRKYNGSDTQIWYFYENPSGNLTLYNIGEGKLLNIDGNTSGSNISLSDVQSNKNEIVLSKYTNTLKYKGVDISVHNGTVNWESVKNQIDFAIIRVGFSSELMENGVDKFQDKQFLRNVEYCEKYNIPYGLYLYSYAKSVSGSENSAVTEANHMLTLINKAKKYGRPNLSIPVYYDQEDKMTYNATGYNATTLTQINDKFCSMIESAGYQCGIYTNLVGFGYMGNANVKNLASKYGIWVAQWPGYTTFDQGFANSSSFSSKYSINPNIWQFTSSGSISGANTNVGHIDLNVGYNIFE